MRALTIVGLVAVLALVQASSTTEGSPVGQVVDLIKELKTKIEADGVAEQKLYDKFACWCESTSKRKATDIDEGKDRIQALTTQILELKGKIATLASEIEELTKHIADNEQAQEEATALRQKENANYMQEKSEMETALGALEKAITVLGGAGTKGEFITVASALRAGMKTNAALSQESAHVVRAFLEDPADFYAKKAQAKNSYSPASATIQGILKDMYTTFSADLEAQTKDESVKQADFEDYIAAKEEELAEMKATLLKKEAQHAESSKLLADTETDLADTEEKLAADEKFFDESKDMCQKKADEWSERNRLRQEELAGISKALEILTSDEARELLSKATGNRANKFDFVQIDSQTDRQSRAVVALRQFAAKAHSLRLATLASALRSAAPSEFAPVLKAIDDVMKEMKQEEADDIKQRDTCIAEQHEYRGDRDDAAYKVNKLATKIGKLEIQAERIDGEIDNTVESMKELQNTMDEAEEQRKAEHENYQATKKDDLDAAELLGKAIGALSSYFKNNGMNATLLQEEPEFAVSQDQAPDATFSGKGKHSGASKGVVALLTQIKEDLEDDVKTADKEEAESQQAYETLRAQQKETMEGLRKTKANLEEQHADTLEKIQDTKDEKETTEDIHGSKVEYLDKIKANCEWIRLNFETRLTKRKAEMEGLLNAKSILDGAQGGEFGLLQAAEEVTTSFLQRRN